MTRFVTFGGQTQFKPGGLTRITADALTTVGLSATGIVHLIGEADGGAPGSEEVAIIDDPALAREVFKSGPLADAIRVAFAPSGDARIPGGAFRVIAYKTNQSTKSTTQLPGDEANVSDTADSGSTSTVVQLTTGGLTADAHIGRWLEWNGEKRRITDNATGSVTVSPAFSAAPSSSDPVKILDSQILLETRDYGAHTTQTTVEFEAGTGEGVVVTLAYQDQVERSDEIAGEPFLRLKYVGGPILDSGPVTNVSSDGLTVTVDVGSAPSLDAWAGMVLRMADGVQRLIAGNTAADPSEVTLDAAHALTTEEAAAIDGNTAEVVNVTTADASIAGASGEATDITSSVSPNADDLNISFTAGMTLRDLVNEINNNYNYEATIPDGVNPDTTLMESFDFGDRATNVDVRFDDAIDPNAKGSFRRDLQVVVDWINDFSELATAERATAGSDEGSELPAFTGGLAGTIRDVPVAFVGGTRGTSSNTDFQNGFDELLKVRGNHIVPLISQDLANEGHSSTATVKSVAAQLLEHVKLARGAGHNEMGGYLGYKGSLSDVLAQAAAENDQDVQLCPQQGQFLDASGTLKLMPEWSMAVAAAGMRSGAEEVGEPLTFKYVSTAKIEQDSSWSPKERTDVNRLLQGGVLFAEKTDAGIRWVRDLTTHLQDDNIAFIAGSTRHAVRFVAYDLRTHLENKFTGEKGAPGTVASIRDEAASKLQEYRANRIIVDSLDPQTGEPPTIPGFRNLRVFINGNVATVRVEIFPVTGITFQLNDIFLQLPRLAA